MARELKGERPLSDAQERALIEAVDYARDFPSFWVTASATEFGWKPGTWMVLNELGLVQIKNTEGAWAVKATEAGIQLCDSMGD